MIYELLALCNRKSPPETKLKRFLNEPRSRADAEGAAEQAGVETAKISKYCNMYIFMSNKLVAEELSSLDQ